MTSDVVLISNFHLRMLELNFAKTPPYFSTHGIRQLQAWKFLHGNGFGAGDHSITAFAFGLEEPIVRQGEELGGLITVFGKAG